MCECCWADKQSRQFHSMSEVDYHAILEEHRLRNCLCVQPTLLGRRKRAGQFWDEEKQRDRREARKEESGG